MPPTFGQRLKSLREQAGLSPSDLAGRAGLHQSHVYDLENGRRPNPGWDTVQKLAEALGVTPDAFLPESGETLS